MALQPLLLPIVSLFKSQGIASARQAMFGLNKDFAHFASSVGKAAGAFAAFQGLAGARDFAIQSVEVTQRFERNLLALQQVFEEVTPQLTSFTREVENYGLSQSRAAQASVFLGSVLKQYGFTTEESATQTERLVKLSQDLATTYGYDVQEALLAVTALFRGEYDPIEKFGVAMKQSEINARIAADGLGALEGEQLALAQAQTRLTMLFERAEDSVGAYGRASGTLYAAQQQLAAVMENVQIAFGASLQEPIAKVINLFTELAQKYGPDVAEIGASIGSAIDALAPLVEKLAETFFLVLAPLQQMIANLAILIGVFNNAVSPALTIVNGLLGLLNDTLNAASIVIGDFVKELGFISDVGRTFLGWIDSIASGEILFSGFLNVVKQITGPFKDFVDQARNNKFTEVSRDAAMLRNAIANTGIATAEAAKELTYFQTELQLIGTYSKDAEGNLTGLSKLFVEIGEEAAKSRAKEELTAIGIEAGAIEEILTRPDWATIFGEISKAAAIATMSMGEAISQFGAGVYFSAVAIVDRINSAFKDNVKVGGKAATDYVKEFYTKLDEEVEKQNARRKLAGMGASEGLIESILGSGGWQDILKIITEGGVRQLRSLQEQFAKTASGIEEINRLQEEAARIAEEAQEAADEAAEALQRQQDEYDNLIAKLEDFKASISTLALDGILSTYEQEVGRFEGAVISSFNNIQSSLESALENGSIFAMAKQQLSDFANAEQQALLQISRQRDELAAKGDWIEGLLRDYRTAFTSALNLTSLLGRIDSQAQQVLVTEVTQQTRAIAGSMRELQLTITRSYTETIDGTVNKTEALINNFRDVAMKAREFGQNLEQLRRLGLDPQLFNQLVQAGVEAGGETAQALVDGGSETINEINSLFKEIGDVGVAVGESVAEDFYMVGEDFASELLDGIRSQQSAFEEAARQMAEAFQDNFNVKVGTATGQVQQVAQLTQQLSAAEQEQQRIQSRIAEQIDILTGGVAGPGARAWAEKKLASYQDQLADVSAQIGGLTGSINTIPVTPLATGGIALGTALAMIGEGGPEAVIPLDKLDEMMGNKGKGGATVNNYYTINASGYLEGQRVVDALKSYQLKNGSIDNELVGFGA